MVDQRSWVHMLSVISKGCVWEIDVWVLSALLQRLKGLKAWVLPALGSYSSLSEPWMPTCTVTYWSRAWSPPFGDWAAGQYSNMIMTTALLKKLRVKVMDWPSMSPDLNPIEHLWGILKRKVEERKVSNIHQLRDVVMEEWKRTPVATCEALVNSMPKRVKAVLENNGGHTIYWHFGPNLDIFT